MQQLSQHMKSVGTPKLFRKGTAIYFQGEIPRDALVVLDGVIKAYMITQDGNEAIIHLFGKDSIVPANWANNQMPVAMFNYDALSDVRAITFSKEQLYEALDTNPSFEKEYRQNLARSQTALFLRVAGLTQSRAIDKICYTLYYLVFRYGIEKKPGVFEINLSLTQGIIAQLIGQTRESTAKNLKVLQDAGVVSYESSTYFVDKPKLENYIGEDTFKELFD